MNLETSTLLRGANRRLGVEQVDTAHKNDSESGILLLSVVGHNHSRNDDGGGLCCRCKKKQSLEPVIFVNAVHIDLKQNIVV